MKKERGGKPAKPGDKDYPDSKSWKKVTDISSEKQSGSPAWQRSAGKNEEGGLNAKGRASYNKATGGHLKAPVTEKHPTGKAKARRHSFCSRMCGMKSKNTGGATAHDPDSRINKSLRKWNCKCSAAVQFGVKLAYEIGNRRQSTNVVDQRPSPVSAWGGGTSWLGGGSTQSSVSPQQRAAFNANNGNTTALINFGLARQATVGPAANKHQSAVDRAVVDLGARR
jgi:hypothetical protein